MTNEQKHQLGKEAVKIVNDLSSGSFKVVYPGKEDAIEVADKILNLLEIKIKNSGQK